MSKTEHDSTPQETPNSGISLPADQENPALSPSLDSWRSNIFQKVWSQSTENRNVTLYGFRRFKTSHLINLRFLEEEISALDHQIYQVGLGLSKHAIDIDRDRLGLRFSRRDPNIPAPEDIITDSMVLKLRNLLKEYDDALTSFNKLMAMETFSLIDDERQSRERTDLHPYEIYKTRLVRVDLGTRATHDPFRRGIQKALQRLQYWRMCSKVRTDEERGGTSGPFPKSKVVSYQNTALIADILSRFLVALMACAFMVLPLIMVSYQKTQRSHLITISVWIMAFSLLIYAILRASNLATMGAIAAYAAVLSVFISNN